MGGSNTDLSHLGDQPLKPAEKLNEDYIEYCDPFDTSVICTVVPGQTELKFLEKELLGDVRNKDSGSLSDEDFDPRACEEQRKERTLSRPDVLNISSAKTVSFDVPSPTQSDLLAVVEEDSTKTAKPLTPYYVRKDSLPVEPPDEVSVDPFDTSFVVNTAPGKAELKIIESDLFDPQTELLHSISDHNFNPRDEKQLIAARVAQTIQDIYNPKEVLTKEIDFSIGKSKPVDLLSAAVEIESKVLTPAAEKCEVVSAALELDPFDTSVASNILPGRTELKLLETELINSEAENKYTVNNFNVKQDLLQHSEDTIRDKPLSPIIDSTTNLTTEEDFDPFDTSIANNIAPGRTELKLLESEFI